MRTQWRCDTSGKDRYGRDLAICSIDKEGVNGWLVREGQAMAFPRYSETSVADQEQARMARKGSGRSIYPTLGLEASIISGLCPFQSMRSRQIGGVVEPGFVGSRTAAKRAGNTRQL
ncbi:thermonuclease family protein [Bradyrhizobium sp. WSM2793]|uniref:thermonuclease family protein n=1 Tax=Bradyrhizobium sp. WSM2793 TaxID=1038866 RepID=UPI0012FB5728|nr:thermonuclease family protein [Bradyrhizobium sp. WSM2793]